MNPRFGLAVVAFILFCTAMWMLLRDAGPGADKGRVVETTAADAVENARPRPMDRRARGGADGLRVYATVVDEDGLPVSDGTVTFECLTASGELVALGGPIAPGEGGELESVGCAGTVCAELTHPSLIPSVPWVLRAGETVTLRAVALARVEGRVEAPDGTLAEGVALAMTTPPDEADPMAVFPVVSRTTTSDGEGVFSFARVERPPCTPCREAVDRCLEDPDAALLTHDVIVLVARAPGYRSTQIEVDLREVDEPIVIRLLPPAAPITGTLRDEAGVSYPRAYVLARSVDRPHEIHRTDAKGGEFELAELGDGPYDLRAIQDGVELARHGGAAAGASVALVGAPSAAGPDLRVEITQGSEPAAGLSVDGGPFLGARTDARGVVEAAQVMRREYVMRIGGPGHRASAHTVLVNASADVQVVRIDL